MEKKFSSFYEYGREDGIAEGIAKGKAEGMAKGKEEGKAEERTNFATRMLQATAMSIFEISALANLALDQVEELAKTIRRPQSVN